METKSLEEKEAWLKHKPNENGAGELPPVRTFTKGGRSTLEKVLLVLVLVFLVALIAVVVVLIVEKNKEKSDVLSYTVDGSDICITKECVSAAARIHSYIDYSVKPCDDLYQFACGRWMKENVIPEDKSSFTTFSVLRDQVDIVLKNLLEEEKKPKDLNSIKKAKDLYASCLNIDLMNKRGDQPLKDMAIDTFGGWPLTHSGWSESDFDMVTLLAKLNMYGLYPVISFFVGIDNKHSAKRILKIDQTSFGMPGQKYYQVARNETMLMAYENLIYNIGRTMGFANDPDAARQEVADIVDFEILLANISVPDEERRDSEKLYNPMTLAEVHANYSEQFNWLEYVQQVTSSPEIGLLDITDDEPVINYSPSYFTKLTEVLRTTPKRVLANYMMWRLVRSLVGTQGEKYKELLKDYRKALFGTSSESPRFRTCSSYTTHNVGLAVGRMFIKDNFDADSKIIALEMIEGLQSSFNELLSDLDWMDDATKEVAREKNEHISPKIGYPDDMMNDTYIEEFYSNVTYHKDQYFENVLVNLRESFFENFRRLREPVDKNKWDSPPSTVNAFYSSVRNQIMFPAGILQPPFFSKTYPKSLNFGGIGVVIGHEITHGFDDRGRQYDKDGNLVQWWSQSAVDKFKTRAQCIVNQYGNFTVPEINMNLNGVNTQGENIADNGGLKQAFKAYRDWVSKQGKEEPKLPGLDFTHNQLFFVNFAQLWCNLMREGDALSRIRTGVHSPGRYRVIGSAQNSPDFAEAFNCPSKSFMNPSKKCTVW